MEKSQGVGVGVNTGQGTGSQIIRSKLAGYKEDISMDNSSDASQLMVSSLLTFLQVLRDTTMTGFKVMQDVDNAICQLGLDPLAGHVVEILSNINQQINNMDLKMTLEKINSPDSEDKHAVVKALAVFFHSQMSIVESAAESLNSLLNTEVFGQTLSTYVPKCLSQPSPKPPVPCSNTASCPKTQSCPYNSPASGQTSNLDTSCNRQGENTPHNTKVETLSTSSYIKDTPDIGSSPGQTSGNTTLPQCTHSELQPQCISSELQHQLCSKPKPATSDNLHQDEVAFNDEQHQLVSDAEMKEVIDLLSGVKKSSNPPPTPPKPMGPPPTPPKPVGHYTMYTPYQQVHKQPAVNDTQPSNHHINTSQPSHHHHHIDNIPSHLGEVPAVYYHRPLGPQMSDSIIPVKTNTWPMRPGREQEDVYRHDGRVYEGFSTDLEFSQYVSAIKQRSRRGQQVNPWSVGDTGATWSPLGLIYDSRDGRQWSTAEDSSNCSDESSCNGDWMLVKPGDTEIHVTKEGKSTATWPPKHPWATVLPSVPTDPNVQATHPSMAAYSHTPSTAWTGY